MSDEQTLAHAPHVITRDFVMSCYMRDNVDTGLRKYSTDRIVAAYRWIFNTHYDLIDDYAEYNKEETQGEQRRKQRQALEKAIAKNGKEFGAMFAFKQYNFIYKQILNDLVNFAEENNFV